MGKFSAALLAIVVMHSSMFLTRALMSGSMIQCGSVYPSTLEQILTEMGYVIFCVLVITRTLYVHWNQHRLKVIH